MGLGGDGGLVGDGGGGDVMVQAEKLSAAAVSHVFMTLCGQTDAPDKFTGMQREMNLYMKNIIRTAVEAGQAAGKKDLAREEYRSAKAFEAVKAMLQGAYTDGDENDARLGGVARLVACYRTKIKESHERRIAELVTRVDTMCNSLEGQKEEFGRTLTEFERTSRTLRKEVHEHETQRQVFECRIQELTREVEEARVNADAASHDADRERQVALVLRDQVRELEARLAEALASIKDVNRRWGEDASLMQTQLQAEVAARIAAEESLREALEASRRQALREDTESSITRNENTTLAQNERTESDGPCSKCGGGELVQELQSAVALLNDELTSAYRLKTAQEEKLVHSHAKALAAAKAEWADKLSAARDGQAHAEKVAQRLEKQLLAQAQTALQQQQASRRGPAPAIKSGKQHTEFKDFTRQIERLTGGSGARKASAEAAGVDVDDQGLAASAAPQPAFVGTARPSSPRVLHSGACLARPGGDLRLGDIKKPTPPIGGVGRDKTRAAGCGGTREGLGERISDSNPALERRGSCPPASLAPLSNQSIPNLKLGSIGDGGPTDAATSLTDRSAQAAVNAGARRPLPRHLLSRGVKGAYTAR